MTQSVIDTSALIKLKSVIGGSTNDLIELIDDFKTDLPVQVKRMQAAALTEDLASLRIAAHSCKSNARDVGATELGECCATLELQCKSGEPVNLAAQLSTIQVESDRVLSALNSVDFSDV